MTAAAMLLPVSCQLVTTSLVRSHSHTTDIRLERAVHVYNQVVCSLAHLNGASAASVRQASLGGQALLCGSVHVGQCRALNATDLQRRLGAATAAAAAVSTDLPSSPAALPIRAGATGSSEGPPTPQPAKSPSPRPSPRASLLASANSSLSLPPFYFPTGPPRPQMEIEAEVARVTALFDASAGPQLQASNLAEVTRACGLPLYWKRPLLLAAAKAADVGKEKKLVIPRDAFLTFWRRLVTKFHDDAARFVALLVKGEERDYIAADDLEPLVQDLIDSHPGLSFLAEAPEFHARYVQTVIARVFFHNDNAWLGRLSMADLRHSNFLTVLASLETTDDINAVTDYFSYEHFYVIYCKFWELDLDHDLLVSREELLRHDGGALSTRIIDRILSGIVTHRPAPGRQGYLSYYDFIWFLLAEEDKQHPRSTEYWFRCLDLDGDGILSMHELHLFYSDQLARMSELGIEPISFQDTLCQMLDMLRPPEPFRIRLGDIKRSRMARIFFDTFFNLPKYLANEQRDPFASAKELGDNPEKSDWERYAAEMYEVLVAEELENANAQLV